MPATPVPDNLQLLEKAESISPTQVAYSPEGGTAGSVYFYKKPQSDPNVPADPITSDELKAQVKYYLGSVDPAVGDGRIHRQLPLALPFPDPSLYVSAIRQIVGMGKPVFTANTQTLEAPAFPYYANYPCYAMQVEWGSRPYAIKADSAIHVASGQYYDENNTLVPFWFADEWLRFTDYVNQPQANFISPNTGQMAFRTTGTAGPGDPNGSAFTAPPKMYLPDEMISFTWYQVPYRYVTSKNSFLKRWKGRVNQNAWYDWDAGQLLYLNYSIQRYTPPMPQIDEWAGGTVSTDKLCNITFQFLVTDRKGVNVPTPTNRNYVAAHHNLLPWFATRKFYYVSGDDQTPGAPAALDQPPAWLSFPIELLFTDPDAAQPGPIT